MTREEAIKVLQTYGHNCRCCAKEGLEASKIAIAALQEQEVIHCKDCRLRKTEECAMQYECDCGEQHSWENDNDYCSWGIKAGERNDGKKLNRN